MPSRPRRPAVCESGAGLTWSAHNPALVRVDANVGGDRIVPETTAISGGYAGEELPNAAFEIGGGRGQPLAFSVWFASALTSEATTAKPRPASPARAASIVALRASKLVWPAIFEIRSTTEPIWPPASACTGSRPAGRALADQSGAGRQGAARAVVRDQQRAGPSPRLSVRSRHCHAAGLSGGGGRRPGAAVRRRRQLRLRGVF